jgi:CIC family chloride channel protein
VSWPRRQVIVAYPDETLRTAADRMAEHQVGTLPVVSRCEPDRFLGLLTEYDLLKARHRQLIEERHRERVLTLRWPSGPFRIAARPGTADQPPAG